MKHLEYIIFFVFFFPLYSYSQKIVYIPASFNSAGASDYCNVKGQNGVISNIDDLKDDNERWSKNRSYQTDNIVCFWESGFGADYTKMINPANTATTFNLKSIISGAEQLINYHINSLGIAYANGTKLNKYKIMIMLSYTTTWTAYGSGYDFTIGAIWVNPAALGVGSVSLYPYFTMAHELFHAMSYQSYCDRPDNNYKAFQDGFNGPFWERSANHASFVLYPKSSDNFELFMYAPQSHILSTRMHYSPSLFLENMDATFGISSIGKIWNNNLQGEHVMNTACRVFFEDNQAELNDFVGQTAMKNITWDYPANSNGAYLKTVVAGITYNTDVTSISATSIIKKKHRTILYAVNYDKRHFAIRDCQAPQDYGYNAIQIFPETTNTDGSATIKMRFRGHTEDAGKKPGWRWGFVAIQQDGTPRYGTLYNDDDKTVSFTKYATDTEVWLIVTGAPTEHGSDHNYTWEAGFPKYYRYPYEVRFENAVPIGYNADFEGAKTEGAPHSNGGGWVASTATVDASAYVGPNAKVLGTATVSGNARIEDFAIVKGKAQVYDNAVIKENAMIFGNAKVYGNAVVSGSARCMTQCEIFDDAFVTDNAFLNYTQVYGNAIACGNLWQKNAGNLGGTCVAGGDCESIGYTTTGDPVSGPELSGTILQYPDISNNNRARKDGKGNLTTEQLATLKTNWNNLTVRFSILNNSISADPANPNYDINLPYSYFSTDDEMVLGKTDEEVTSAIGLSNTSNLISLYPNPTTDGLYVKGLDESALITVFDNKGQIVYSQKVTSSNFINLIWLPKGIYIIKIKNKQGIQELKCAKI